jgi:hypothetical protein
MAEEESANDTQKGGRIHRLATILFTTLRCTVYALGLTWATGAVYYDTPIESDLGRKMIATGYLLVALFFIAGLVTRARRFLGWIFAMALVVVPWSLKKPWNEGNWRTEWAVLPHAEISPDGEVFTFHGFRNFKHEFDRTFAARRETRTVHLGNLQGLDYFHHAFENPYLAHPVLSFDFGPEGRVAFSVEVRYEEGQKYSPIRGVYKQYTLSYLVGDERDFIGDRANARNEPVRLYRSKYSPERIREMFLETVRSMNELKEHPRFYNSITANCTTSYVAQAPSARRAPLDWRIIFNGKLESLLYERDVIETGGLSFDQLMKEAEINEAARAAHNAPDFSARIRVGRPGF